MIASHEAGDVVAPPVYSRRHQATRPLMLGTAAVMLACMCNGWVLGGAGGPFTMATFRQDMEWDINCKPNPKSLDCEVIISDPAIAVWANEDETCFDCCCESNPDADEKGAKSNIASFASWGAAVGAIYTSFMSEALGRRRAVQIACIIMFAGSLTALLANNTTTLLVGRWISGMAMGNLLALGPLFLSELSPPALRGFMGSGAQMALVLAQFLASVCNIFIPYHEHGWRFSYGTPCFFAAAAFVLLFFCPESPKWLYLKGKDEKCFEVLNKIRKPELIPAEVAIYEQNRLDHTSAPMYKIITDPYHRWKTLSCFMLHAFQQFSGILVTTNFSPMLYAQFFGAEIASYSFVIFNVVRVLILILGIALTEKMGRVKQLVIGGAIMSIGQLVIAFAAIPYNLDGPPTADWPNGTPPYLNDQTLAIVVIIFSYVYVGGYSIGWGNLPFVVTAEYMQSDVRGHAMGISSVIVWIAGAITTGAYPYMSSPDAMDLYGTYFFYSAFTIGATIFTMCCLMETRAIPMEQMQGELDEFKANYSFKIQKNQIRRRR